MYKDWENTHCMPYVCTVDSCTGAYEEIHGGCVPALDSRMQCCATGVLRQ